MTLTATSKGSVTHCAPSSPAHSVAVNDYVNVNVEASVAARARAEWRRQSYGTITAAIASAR